MKEKYRRSLIACCAKWTVEPYFAVAFPCCRQRKYKRTLGMVLASGSSNATTPVHHAARRGAAWPRRAQQDERVRRVSVLAYWTADDAEGHGRLAAFTQALACIGWSEGRNRHIDARATANAANFADTRRNWSRSRRTSFSATGTATVAALLQHDQPIVFATVIDPVEPVSSPAWQSRVAA